MSIALVYCALLSLQFGLQPITVVSFQDPNVSKTAIVMATEFAKIGLELILIFLEPVADRIKLSRSWSLSSSLSASAFPAVLFCIQNVLIQHAFRKLDSLTFNLINQTKVNVK